MAHAGLLTYLRPVSGGGLQPTADGPLIVHVLRTEFPFQVLLFSRYDDRVDQRHRTNERSQQPHAVDPDRDTELEQGERQIDRVPTSRFCCGLFRSKNLKDGCAGLALS